MKHQILYTSIYYHNYYRIVKNPFILVLHNSDDSFGIDWLFYALTIPNLIKIFTENMNVLHDKVVPIPIGIPNAMWQEDNLSTWKKILAKK